MSSKSVIFLKEQLNSAMKKAFIFFFIFNAFVAESKAHDPIPFTLTPSGHIVIKAAVNGIQGNFIFDTGAGLNLFFKDFAQKLHVKESDNFFVAHRATGEAITTPIYYAKDLKIGDKHFQNQVYSTFDINLEGIDGLLSLQAFQHTPITIDYENKIITLNEINSKDKKKYIDIQIADYAEKALDIFTYVTLNNKTTIQVALDAGAGSRSFWIHSKFMKTLDLDTGQFNSFIKKSEFDSLKSNRFYKGSIASIKTTENAVQIQNPKVVFVEGLIYEGKTSIDWLGKKIAISLPEKKIFIIK
ncbi:retropepsin-like aspartic protease [Olivibacter sp. CPCC 100613]|uniref:retropepsin-like aspartic protease n=1 Tax=Olivibacter sp. CPCC 100613 TaxID=3079931 RepID=UPI002FF9C8D7